MQGSSILNPLFTRVIDTGLVKSVYHSVILREIDKRGISPVAKINTSFKYVGIDDTKGFFAYCRQTGPLEVLEAEPIGGCQMKRYKTQIPHRLVFYNDTEKRSHDEIIAKLTKAVIGAMNIKLNKVHSDPKTILQSESPKAVFHYRPKTFYCAIDFFVLLKIQADTCETEFTCEDLQNPFCGVTE